MTGVSGNSRITGYHRRIAENNDRNDWMRLHKMGLTQNEISILYNVPKPIVSYHLKLHKKIKEVK